MQTIKNGKKEKVSLVDRKTYENFARRSGEVILCSNEETRLYSDTRVNGTTAIILAAIAASGNAEKAEKIVTPETFRKGADILLSEKGEERYEGRRIPKNRFFELLLSNWKTIGGSSRHPVLKIGVVLNPLRNRDSYLRGFDVANIADAKTRELFGFKI